MSSADLPLGAVDSGVRIGHAALMGDDPEVEIYDDLPLDLRAAMFDACSRARNEAATTRGVDPDDAGALRAVGVSQGLNDDGDPWLRLVATDGTTCYLGWAGDNKSAIESATEFGRNLADDILPWASRDAAP